MIRRHRQKQAWLDIPDLCVLREMKKVKETGELETDAEVFNRLIKSISQDLDKLTREIRVRMDRKDIFK